MNFYENIVNGNKKIEIEIINITQEWWDSQYESGHRFYSLWYDNDSEVFMELMPDWNGRYDILDEDHYHHPMIIKVENADHDPKYIRVMEPSWTI